MTRDVGGIGVGYSDPESFTDYRLSTMSKKEQAHEAITAALEHADAEPDDIDVALFCTVDGFEGTFRVERTLEVLGMGNDIPVISINTGGTAGGSGVKVAYEYLASGDYDTALIYGSPSFDSVVEAQPVMNTNADPLFERNFVTAIQMGALPSSGYMEISGATLEDFAKVAAQNYQNATRNPYAHRNEGKTVEEVLDSPMVSWPLRRAMTCPVSSGAAAMVMAEEETAYEHRDNPVWVEDIDSIANNFETSYRTMDWFPKLKTLADRIYEREGIDTPLEAFDVCETFNPYIPFELIEYEAMGFCEKGEGKHLIRDGVTARDGKLPVNCSGGTLATNSGICASLSRHTEVVLQLMGEAGERQVDDAELGLAQSWGANLGQFQEMCIFAAD
ncbi:MAG: thiolase family protein [Halovenus sp.]